MNKRLLGLVLAGSILISNIPMGVWAEEKKPTPTEPTGVTTPADPTEALKPTVPKPTDPTEGTKPTDPTQVPKPTDPTEDPKPTDPTEDHKPTDPTEDTKPTDSTEPTEPVKATVTVTGFTWVDEWDLLTEGVFSVPAGSLEELRSVLPGQIRLPDDSLVDILKWTCPEYVEDEEGNWPAPGSFRFQAEFPENVIFAKSAPARELSVETFPTEGEVLAPTNELVVTTAVTIDQISEYKSITVNSGGVLTINKKVTTETLTINGDGKVTIAGPLNVKNLIHNGGKPLDCSGKTAFPVEKIIITGKLHIGPSATIHSITGQPIYLQTSDVQIQNPKFIESSGHKIYMETLPGDLSSEAVHTALDFNKWDRDKGYHRPFTYNGQNHEVGTDIRIYYKGGCWYLKKASEEKPDSPTLIEIKYTKDVSTDPVEVVSALHDAGKYWLTYQYNGAPGGPLTARAEFIVNKKVISLSRWEGGKPVGYSGREFAYDGQPKTPTPVFNNVLEGDKVQPVMKYAKYISSNPTELTEYTDEVPSEPGKYSVKLLLDCGGEDGHNYELTGKEKTCTFTIKKPLSELTVTGFPTTITYGDDVSFTVHPKQKETVKTRAAAVPNDTLYLYYGSSKTHFKEFAVPADQDTQISFTAGRDFTYDGRSQNFRMEWGGSAALQQAAVTKQAVLQKKTLTAQVAPDQSKVYNEDTAFTGAELTITDGLLPGDTVTARADGTLTSADAGDRDFTPTAITLEGGQMAYYTLPAANVSGTVKVTQADQAPLTIQPEGTPDWEFGDQITLKTQGGSGSGAVTWSIAEGNDIARISQSGVLTITGVGSFQVQAEKAQSLNYHAASAAGEYTARKRILDLQWPASAEYPYDGKPHKPDAELMNVVDGQTCTVTVTGEQIAANAEGETYTATAESISNTDYYQLPTANTTTFTILKAEPAAELFTASNLEIQYDGLPHSPTVTFNQKDAEGTELTGMGQITVDTALTQVGQEAQIQFHVGAGSNYNAATGLILNQTEAPFRIVNEFTPEETVNYTFSRKPDSWSNENLVISPVEGYQLSTGNEDGSSWGDALTGSTPGAASQITFYVRNTETKAISLPVTVTYQLDQTAPTGTAQLVEPKPTVIGRILSAVGFDSYSKNDRQLEVSAQDDAGGSGIQSIQYFESASELTQDQVAAHSQWSDYGDKVLVKVADGKKALCYVKLLDQAGNVTYLNTQGVTFDTSAPSITGVNGGAVFYTTRAVEVSDPNLESVTLNGQAQTVAGTTLQVMLPGGVSEETVYTVAAVDKAGNRSELTVTMKPLSEKIPNPPLDAKGQALAEATVTEDDRAALTGAKTAVEELQAEIPNHQSEAEKAYLKGAGDRIDDMLTILDNTKKTVDAELKKVSDKKTESVKLTDQADLEASVGAIENLLSANKNLSAAQKQALTAAKDRANTLLESIAGIQADIKAVKDAVTGREISKVTGEDKKALEDAKALAEKLLGTEHLTEEQITSVTADKTKAEQMLEQIQKAQDAKNPALESSKDVNTDNLQLKNKEELQNTKTQLESLQKPPYKDNYTDEEKQKIQQELDRVNELLASIERTEKVQDLIEKLPQVKDPDVDKATEEKVLKAEAEAGKLTDKERGMIVTEICKLGTATKALRDYKIVKANGKSGTKARWDRKTNLSVTFTANGPFRNFKDLLIDGSVVDKANYTAKEGSTVVTLQPGYLRTLSNGKHTVEFTFDDGVQKGKTPKGTLEITESVNPKTGDSFRMGLWISLMAVSALGAAGAAVLLLTRRKRR